MLPTIALAATLLFAAVASAAPGHKPGEAHDHRAYGEPGDPRKPARVVQVTMREADGRMIFAPDRIAVRRGYYPAGKGQREDAIVMSMALGER